MQVRERERWWGWADCCCFSAPNKTADYQKIYSDWCNQFEKYKLAIQTWEKKKGKCGKVNVNL